MSITNILQDAERLLVARFGDHFSNDTRARFNTRDQRKQLRLTTSDTLGTFDAWTDRIALNAEVDPLGTAVHELLHANAFADDWLPQDTGREGVVCFRGFEIQHLNIDATQVYAIYHRGINEAVTELLTRHAYPDAGPAYVDLLPIAQQLATHIGFDRLSALYFRAGYPGLETLIEDDALCELSAAADVHLQSI